MLLYPWHVPLVVGFEVVSLREVETIAFCPAQYRSVTVTVSVAAPLLVHQPMVVSSPKPNSITPGQSRQRSSFIRVYIRLSIRVQPTRSPPHMVMNVDGRVMNQCH